MYPKIAITSKHEDITGHIFGNLKTLYLTEPKNKKSFWVCECTCGKVKPIRVSQLKSGDSKSCGCKKNKITHGKSDTPIT